MSNHIELAAWLTMWDCSESRRNVKFKNLISCKNKFYNKPGFHIIAHDRRIAKITDARITHDRRIAENDVSDNMETLFDRWNKPGLHINCSRSPDRPLDRSDYVETKLNKEVFFCNNPPKNISDNMNCKSFFSRAN